MRHFLLYLSYYFSWTSEPNVRLWAVMTKTIRMKISSLVYFTSRNRSGEPIAMEVMKYWKLQFGIKSLASVWPRFLRFQCHTLRTRPTKICCFTTWRISKGFGECMYMLEFAVVCENCCSAWPYPSQNSSNMFPDLIKCLAASPRKVLHRIAAFQSQWMIREVRVLFVFMQNNR